MDLKKIISQLVVAAIVALTGAALLLWRDVELLKAKDSPDISQDALNEHEHEKQNLSDFIQKDELLKLLTELNFVRKNEVTDIPIGVVVYVRSNTCPNDNWEVLENARGRYIVGLNSNGIVGEAVGSALKNSEARQIVGVHKHELTGSGDHAHAATNAGAHTHLYSSTANGDLYDNTSNFKGNIYRIGTIGWKDSGDGGGHSHSVVGPGDHSHNITNEGDSTDVSAPYIQLLACEKIK